MMLMLYSKPSQLGKKSTETKSEPIQRHKTVQKQKNPNFLIYSNRVCRLFANFLLTLSVRFTNHSFSPIPHLQISTTMPYKRINTTAQNKERTPFPTFFKIKKRHIFQINSTQALGKMPFLVPLFQHHCPTLLF